MHRLLSVNNISSAAYRLVSPGSGNAVECATPAKIHKRVLAGQCDAALLPVACLESVAVGYEPIGEYGIACRGAVGSVLLFCNLPLEAIARDELPIFISEQSRTSRVLFQYLYKKRFGALPVLSDRATDAFAHVYIGNDAIRLANAGSWQAEVVDLCEWWCLENNHSFVFARWVVRSCLSGQDKEIIEDWLDKSTGIAATQNGKYRMADMSKDTFGSISMALNYYERIRFRLSPSDLLGLENFKMVIEESAKCAQIA